MVSQSDGLLAMLPGIRREKSAAISPPKRRWLTRVLLPAVVFGVAASLLAYSARSAFMPATEVWLAPVVPLALADSNDDQIEVGPNRDTALVQAPGWIEPDPYPINVPILTEGVVKELLVLEGDRVEAEQVVATLFDDDARLQVEATEAELAGFKAELAKLEADFGAAKLHVEKLEDELGRARQIATSGGGAAGESIQLGFELRAAGQRVKSAQAAVDVARAQVKGQETACRVARLQLSRTRVLAPAGGTVMQVFLAPGARITKGGGNSSANDEMVMGAAMQLYDPNHLQVRVDVPLADIGKIRIGAEADVVTEALPDVVLEGTVTRMVHQANIQRNTVQFKVAIKNPRELLKPEMLARVRFYGGQDSGPRPFNTDKDGTISDIGLRLLIPQSALIADGEKFRVWLVQHDERAGATIAISRDVHISSNKNRGHVEVAQGVQAGDKVVVDPPAHLKDGVRVRVMGERVEAAPAGSGSTQG